MASRPINVEELHELFKLIGQGIWYLQTVEDALHTTITLKHDIKTRGAIPQEEAIALLSKQRMKTLGKSLEISRKARVLSESLQKRLESFKEERDWLVHRSVHQNGDDLYLDEKRFVLMQRIKSFSEKAKILQKLIASELENFVVAQGVIREDIMKEATEALKN